jgi:transcriptional regulator with GAF, ATPase, and Fis domain
MRLRAEVWQSIFTHDIRRYLRSLYHRMGDIITLITGPSGTGKELVARAIALSRYIPFDERRGRFETDFTQVFQPLSLSSLSPNLIESELFGHRKGAFTGALENRKGYLETCGPWGAVFLDEIGEVDAAIQVKLLRVLQTRRFQRLGDTRSVPFLGKLIAATNRSLADELQAGSFRQDLYYRLCADRIVTPALREILAEDPEELRYLVHHVATHVAGETEADHLTEEVCTWVSAELGSRYEWPGNFRELEQCVRNMLIRREYRPEKCAGNDFQQRFADCSLTAAEVLSHYVTRVYARTGNYEETARGLQLDPRTVKKHIDPELLQRLADTPQTC